MKEGNKKLSEFYTEQNQPKPEPEWKKKKVEEVKAE